MNAQKLVSIKLFKDGKNYADDVFVGINGRRYLIQRGVELQVPYAVAKVLEDSRSMEQSARESIDDLQSRYRKRIQP